MNTSVVRVLLVLVACLTAAVPARAGGFDLAIQISSARVVKLYGLGAGVQAGYGTGVVISSDGLVLTVFSLLIDARQVRAVGADGTPFRAKVVYRDRGRQLALLQLLSSSPNEQEVEVSETVGPLPFFDIRKETPLFPGDWVLAAGNAFKVADGAEPVSIAHGVFSARTRLDARRRKVAFPYQGDVLVIDAITSNPGAPGSALVNLDGEFVGMIGRVVMSNRTYTHFNYAVPRDVLVDFLTEAESSGASDDKPVSKASPLAPESGESFDTGIRVSRVGYRKVLPFVEHVRAGSLAESAGVRKDDLILSVNGRAVPDVAAYQEQVARIVPEGAMELVIRRGRKILNVRIEREGS